MYSNIHELPSQVTASLDDDDAKIWMDTYNKLNPQTEEEIKDAKKSAWHKCKKLPSSFSFRIKASVDAVDKDKEVIDLDSIKNHIDSYIDYGGPVQWEHGDYQVGNIWDWRPIKVDGRDAIEVYGNVYGGDQVYDNMRKMFVEGNNSLSVAGEAGFGKYQCDEKGCYMRRDVKQLLEISLCKVPANKHCTLSWYNKDAKLTKSAQNEREGYYNFGIDEYEIHKSYKECPMLGLKKSLSDIGYETHATEVGVFVPMSYTEYQHALPIMKSAGVSSVWYDGQALLNDKEYLIEITFKDGLKKGYIDPDGRVNEKVTKSQFDSMLEKDVLYKDGSEYFIGDL